MMTTSDFQQRSSRHDLNTTKDLPTSPESITPKWLSESFGLKVEGINIRHVIPGTATKVLADLEYPVGSQVKDKSSSHPTAICIKGGFDQSLFDLGMTSAYLREVHFFAEFGNSEHVRTPHMWYGATNPTQGQGIVIMEDLSAKGCKFGECTEPWHPVIVGRVLEQLAVLHAATWGANPADHPWLADNPVQDVGAVMFAPEYWDSHFNTGQAPSDVPDFLRDRARVHAAFKQMWEEEKNDTRLRCILHGDAHIGNTYFEKDGDPVLLDYQTVYIGSAMHDVAYWIGGSLSTEDRRLHERELLDTYLRALHTNGAPLFQRHEVWEDYSKHMLHGFFWVITGTAMQTRERAHAMAQRFIASIEDLSSLYLLESRKKCNANSEDIVNGN
ncbi:kinase-like domain-containing protein [Ilyonectria destructans]|nr:kinase-like domain-containing protein [Ilyonectria destructans]